MNSIKATWSGNICVIEFYTNPRRGQYNPSMDSSANRIIMNVIQIIIDVTDSWDRKPPTLSNSVPTEISMP